MAVKDIHTMRAKVLFIVLALVAYGHYLQTTQKAVSAQLDQIGGVYQRAMIQAEEMANNAKVSNELVQYSSGK